MTGRGLASSRMDQGKKLDGTGIGRGSSQFRSTSIAHHARKHANFSSAALRTSVQGNAIVWANSSYSPFAGGHRGLRFTGRRGRGNQQRIHHPIQTEKPKQAKSTYIPINNDPDLFYPCSFSFLITSLILLSSLRSLC